MRDFSPPPRSWSCSGRTGSKALATAGSGRWPPPSQEVDPQISETPSVPAQTGTSCPGLPKTDPRPAVSLPPISLIKMENGRSSVAEVCRELEIREPN